MERGIGGMERQNQVENILVILLLKPENNLIWIKPESGINYLSGNQFQVYQLYLQSKICAED
jgi:hypothetical protein